MKNSTSIFLAVISFFGLVFVIGCSGNGGGEEAGSQVEFNIGSDGGAIELKSVAIIVIPDNAFSSGSILSIEDKSDQEFLDIYKISADLFAAGDSSGQYLKVSSTALPEKDFLIRYTVPTEFINLLSNDFVPRLFVQIFQFGADDEILDYFEPLDFELTNGVLSATLPKSSFTDFRSENAGEFEAIILIGSSPIVRVQTTNKLGLSMKSQAPEINSCQGTTLGSPLERALEITSPFGDLGAHNGVDLRAAIGDKVLATADGTIFKIGFDERDIPNRFGGRKKGWGRYVIITHTDGSQTLYAHLIKSSTDALKVGDTVIKSTTVIGLADSTGGVTGPHLHLEYVPNGQIFLNKDQKVDPFPCINANLMGLTATAISSTQINLSWTVPTDNVGVAGYNVYRDGVRLITKVSTTSHSDTGLSPSIQYCYAVSAFDLSDNESVGSAQVCATTQSAQGQTSEVTTIKDIWTTSAFSYAPDGGGPGGGLDNHELVVGGWGDLYYTLIEFDLSNLPTKASSATLMLFPFTQRGIGTTGMYLDMVTEFWDWKTEGTGIDRDRLWWADRPATIQWIPSLLLAPTLGEWYSIDITDLYNAWQDGTYSNYGVQLRPFSNANQWNEFYSSDFPDDPSLQPRLVIVETPVF